LDHASLSSFSSSSSNGVQINSIDRCLARQGGLGKKTSGQGFGLSKNGQHRNSIKKLKPSACSATVPPRRFFDHGI